MLNSKQRSYLRSMAQGMSDTIYVGKEGVDRNVIVQLNKELTANELVKGKVLNNSDEDVRQVAERLSDACSAEVVQIIGKKFVLYKKNKEKQRIILP